MKEENIHIKIIDTSGVEQMLVFDFRKHTEHFDFKKFTSYIKSVFKSRFLSVKSLFGDAYPELLTINLEQEKREGNHSTLACFDAYISTATELRFRFYYSSLVRLYDDWINKTNKTLDDFNNTVLHELIHAIDMNTIKEILAKQKKRKSIIYHNPFGYEILNTDKTQASDYSVQWMFLSFLTTFRNEGIALLGEKLLGKSNSTISADETLTRFKHDFEYIITACRNLKFYNRIQSSTAYRVTEQLKKHAYNYGEVLLLQILKNKFKDRFDFQLISDFLYDKTGVCPDKNEILDLLTRCISYDLSEYINGILKLKNGAGGNLIDHSKFYEYCGFLQHETDDNIHAFSKNIMYAGNNHDANAFLDIVKSVMGMPMQVEEITTLFSKFESKTFTDDIADEVKYMGKKLLNWIDYSKSEIVIWALTYLLDDEDLIYDNIDFLGLQDDWFVLDAAVKLVHP